MAQTAYEFECNRAELLGINKPNFEEFCKEYEARKAEEEAAVDTEILKETETENESLKNMSGGLEELNNILKRTQKRLNNFKVASITDFLKDKIGRRGSTASTDSVNSELAEEKITNNQPCSYSNINNDNLIPANEDLKSESSEATEALQRKSDLSKAVEKNAGIIDNLINKAENCEISLRHQNQQMRNFLSK